MNIRSLPVLLAACFFGLVIGACSQNVPTQTLSTDGRKGASCDLRMLRTEDLSGILSSPLVDQRPVAGDVQTCQFLTEGFSAITVSVRPHVGHATLDAWSTGRMPFSASPLPGIGDQAVWQDTLHEVIAQKNDLLCDIAIRGGEGDITATIERIPALLGALCNKVFAAFG